MPSLSDAPESTHPLIPRFPTPGNDQRFAAVLDFIISAPAHIAGMRPALFPVFHGKPLHRLIWLEDLILPQTRPSPEIHSATKRGIHAGGDTDTFGIPHPQQQEIPGWQKVFH